MKMQRKLEPTKPSDGLTIDQALAFHEGWAAARRAEPLDIARGSMWVEGWIAYGWAKGAPSGARH